MRTERVATSVKAHEWRVRDLIARNVNEMLRNGDVSEKHKRELCRAYEARNRAYAEKHGISIEEAQSHYARIVRAISAVLGEAGVQR